MLIYQVKCERPVAGTYIDRLFKKQEDAKEHVQDIIEKLLVNRDDLEVSDGDDAGWMYNILYKGKDDHYDDIYATVYITLRHVY